MTSDSLDLDCLNAAERETLALLAAGHTAKSIASLTGRTEGAINERLREARRKTGVGSSRELARLLRQQESRDEEIGVVSSDAPEARSVRSAGEHDRHFRKVMVMIALLTLISAALLNVSGALAPPQVTSSLPADPMVESVFGPQSLTPQATRQRFLAETRDPVWAPRTEAVLSAAYRHIEGVEPDLRVRCASTLCEVVGRARSGKGAALNRTMESLQGRSLMERLSAIGLHSPNAAFGGTGKTSIIFVAYWTSAKL